MSVTEGDLLALHAATPRSAVKQREGPHGRALDYVDARYVQNFLDDTVGPANWQRRHTIGPDGKVSCDIGILVARKVGEDWVWKADGAGDTDIEGEKGSFSDAFKRAAVNWGIARDLYGSQHTAPPPAAARPTPATEVESRWDYNAKWSEGEVEDALHPQDLGICPVHRKPWRTNSRGYYCASKVGDGWCKEQPPAQWAALQETVA